MLADDFGYLRRYHVLTYQENTKLIKQILSISSKDTQRNKDIKNESHLTGT